MQHTITIEYCPKCNWLLRAAYFAQEILQTFTDNVEQVILKPSSTNGAFIISVNQNIIFDRKTEGGFLEIKIIKQRVRDIVAPEKSLGHADVK
jgi:selenoprotein W-related protein